MKLQWICLACLTIVDALIFPGMSANKSCEVNNSKGMCIPIKNCTTKSEDICDLFQEIVYTCCVESALEVGNIHVRGLESSETECSITLDNPDVDQYSYLAVLEWDSVFDKSNFKCGGVLVNPKYIITAAHCVDRTVGPPKYARIGGKDIKFDHINTIDIQRIIVHPNYKPELSYFDIAIVELKYKSTKTPACLFDEKPHETTDVISVGFCEDLSSNLEKLQTINLNICPENICKQYYSSSKKIPNGLSGEQFCAVNLNSLKNVYYSNCFPGPLLSKHLNSNYVVGIWSIGSAFGAKDPEVYTNISIFKEWIENVIDDED